MKLQIKDNKGTFSEELVLKLNAENPCGTKPGREKVIVRQVKSKVPSEPPSRRAFIIFDKPLNADCKEQFKGKYIVNPKNKKVLVSLKSLLFFFFEIYFV